MLENQLQEAGICFTQLWFTLFLINKRSWWRWWDSKLLHVRVDLYLSFISALYSLLFTTVTWPNSDVPQECERRSGTRAQRQNKCCLLWLRLIVSCKFTDSLIDRCRVWSFRRSKQKPLRPSRTYFLTSFFLRNKNHEGFFSSLNLLLLLRDDFRLKRVRQAGQVSSSPGQVCVDQIWLND